MNKTEYCFDPETAYQAIESHWKAWAYGVGAKKFVLGISGGKDSTVVAHLAARLFGPQNVYGVMMPNGEQKDIGDSRQVVEETGIIGYTCNIGISYTSILYELVANIPLGEKISESTKLNLPPRLRMATIYAVAQTVGAFVLNTDNLSERILGYFTAYGDGAGDYAPLRGMTATEVVRLGKWLGVSDKLINKKPGDGLQPCGDEERFGFTYEALDRYIRTGEAEDGLLEKAMPMYVANRFKTEIVDIRGPKFDDLHNEFNAKQ